MKNGVKKVLLIKISSSKWTFVTTFYPKQADWRVNYKMIVIFLFSKIFFLFHLYTTFIHSFHFKHDTCSAYLGLGLQGLGGVTTTDTNSLGGGLFLFGNNLGNVQGQDTVDKRCNNVVVVNLDLGRELDSSLKASRVSLSDSLLGRSILSGFRLCGGSLTLNVKSILSSVKVDNQVRGSNAGDRKLELVVLLFLLKIQRRNA